MNVKEAYGEAKKCYDNKEYEESIEILREKVLELNHNHANGLQLLGLNQIKLGSSMDAKANILKAINLKPAVSASLPYHLSLGICYLSLATNYCPASSNHEKYLQEAYSSFDYVKKQSASCISAYLGLKEYFILKKEIPQAIEILKEALRIRRDPFSDHKKTKIIEGKESDIINEGTGQEEKAFSDCQDVIEIFYQLGKLNRQIHNFEESYKYFQQVLIYDPSHELAQYWVAVVKINVINKRKTGEFSSTFTSSNLDRDDQEDPLCQPRSAPARYVSLLFDGYADNFDKHITNQLQYRTPEVLINMTIKKSGISQFENSLDLGCGTGLSGNVLVGCTSGSIVGIDLSPKMIAIAEKKAIYQSLIVGDIVQGVENLQGEKANLLNFDLIFAADVVVYMGDLQPLLESVKGLCSKVSALRRERNSQESRKVEVRNEIESNCKYEDFDTDTGESRRPWSHIFAFSTEAALNNNIEVDSTNEENAGNISEGKISYMLQDTARYCHSKAYLKTVTEETGWEIVDKIETTFIRNNRNKKLYGHLVVLGLPSFQEQKSLQETGHAMEQDNHDWPNEK